MLPGQWRGSWDYNSHQTTHHPRICRTCRVATERTPAAIFHILPRYVEKVISEHHFWTLIGKCNSSWIVYFFISQAHCFVFSKKEHLINWSLKGRSQYFMSLHRRPTGALESFPVGWFICFNVSATHLGTTPCSHSRGTLLPLPNLTHAFLCLHQNPRKPYFPCIRAGSRVVSLS